MTYRLRMLGPPSLADESGETPAGLGRGKPLAVLCYLAVEGEVRRETITALLWGESEESRARNAFRQALHRLRTALGDDVVPHDPEKVRVAADADLVVDIDEFDRALAEGRHGDAVEIVGGDFLEGFETGETGFDHWADGERARLRARFLGALREAVTTALSDGRSAEAVGHAERLTREDSLDSSAAVLYGRALAADGRVEEAARSLRAHAERYRAEVGDEPPEELERALTGLERGERPDDAGVARDAPSSDLVLHPDALRRLLAAWRTTETDQAAAVLLVGGEGSGKTWLVDELTRRIRPVDRPLVLRGAVRMGEHGLAYACVAEAMRGVLRARGLAGASSHLLAEASRLLPELRDRFDLPEPAPVTEETDRLRFYEGVASLLDAVAFEQPVLVALQGLHDADAPTIDLIHFLVSRLQASPILFLLTMRPGSTASGVLSRLGGLAEVEELEAVRADALRELLRDRFPGVSDEDLDRAVAASAGIPGKAIQLVRRLEADLPLGTAPVRFADVVETRVEAASPRERRILSTLSLVGRPLSIRRLAACTHLPEGAVLDGIAGLRRRGLVRERSHGVEATDGVTDAVLRATGPAAQALLAGWAAEALAADRAATDAELAALCGRAGRGGEAARYAEVAGRTAVLLGDIEQARAHYERALHWTDDEETAARLRRLLDTVRGGQRALGTGTESPRRLPLPRVGLAALALLVAAVMFAMASGPDRGDAFSARRVVRDTLVMVRTDPDGSRARMGFTGAPEQATSRRPINLGPRDEPRWIDALRGEGRAVLLSPDGRRAALSGGAEGGQRRLVSVSLDRSDTVVVGTADGEIIPLDWAPDGSRMLFADPEGLWTADAMGSGRTSRVAAVELAALDTAIWSPDGARIAWTMRQASAEGREVYVAFVDGSKLRRLTDHPADDYHPAWAPAGDRVAFTSDRTGDAEIYATEVLTGRLWRLTWNDAHDDRASFSPDGEFVAFESTRGGEPGTYVISSYGGQPVRVSAPGQRVEHAGWMGYPPPHLTHLKARTPAVLAPGDAAQLVVEPVFDDYVARNRSYLHWEALDPEVAGFSARRVGDDIPEAAVADTFLEAHRPGLARFLISAGGWRSDTVFVKVGAGPETVFSRDFDRSDGPWEWRSATWVPVTYGLRATATTTAGESPSPSGRARLGLQLPRSHAFERSGVIAELTWSASDQRVTYRVDREQRSETLPELAAPVLEIRVHEDGRVAFVVDRRTRWRSSVRIFGGALPVHRTRVVLATDGEEVDIGFGSIDVVVAPRN